MPAEPHNVITGMPPLRFRGVLAPPYSIAPTSGGHTQAPRDYPYMDAAGHDNVRRDPIQMNFNLLFLNSLGEDLFPGLFTDWTEIFVFDGRFGEMQHPYFGKIDVRPLTWDIDVNANSTSGCVMNVSFTETVKDPTEIIAIEGAIISVREAAKKADEAIEAAGIEYPTGERTDDLLDLVNQLESFVFSTRLTLEGMKNQALGILNGIIDSVENINSHLEWATQDALIELWEGLKDIEKRLGGDTSRKTHFRKLIYDTTMDSFASEVDNTVGEIMTLNTVLLGKPSIPSGSQVYYYTE